MVKQATTKTTTQIQNLIQETNDYGLFQLLPHNRPVVRSHVMLLAQSMKDRPHLRPTSPILVNEDYQVIDGQHRLEASKLNEQTVFFMVVHGLTIEDARLLNALQRTWRLLDYAYSYASDKVGAYVQFVETYEERKLPPSTILEYMAPNARQRHHFRTGQLERVDQNQLDVRLDRLQDVLGAFTKLATPYMVSSAFRVVQGTEGYDHDRMLKKLKDNKLNPQSDRINYIRELERIYNTDVTFGGPNYLRFF